jgi:hypothetical protein
MVNDDLQQLQQIPTTLGFDAARCIIDDVVTTLTGAGTFFSASNGNLLEGPTSALSIESLGAAVKALRTAEDRDGRTIGFVPTTLMIPAALEMTANEILNSTMTFRDQSVDNQASGNPFMNIKLYLYVEPQLDKTSTSAWYLFSPPQQGGAILVSFVAGKETPYIETSQGDFNTLGQKWRGWINSGCGLGDYRAVVRADGV